MSFSLDVFDSYTVLVLGAGASAHLGYPVGSTLCNKILENTKDPTAAPFIQLCEMGFDPKKISEFHQEFHACGLSSIDEFLPNRKKFLEIGRATIASELIKYENLNNLRSRPNNWYFKLTKKVREQIDKNAAHGLVVVTFNYDRSLDKFLHDFFASTYPEQAKHEDVKRWIPIFHVHGQLGYLDHQTEFDPRRPYEPTASPKEILASSKSIQVPVELEGRPLGKELVEARLAIRSNAAPKVVFLGFGYDRTNLRRLQIDDPLFKLSWVDDKKYLGTAFKLGRSTIEELFTASHERLSLGDPTTPVYEFLDEQNCW